MQIKPVNNSPYYTREVPGKNSDPKESGENKIKDKLELSEEAKNIQKTQGDNTNMDTIKERIKNKFYDSQDVVNKVADNILKEIKPQ